MDGVLDIHCSHLYIYDIPYTHMRDEVNNDDDEDEEDEEDEKELYYFCVLHDEDR